MSKSFRGNSRFRDAKSNEFVLFMPIPTRHFIEIFGGIRRSVRECQSNLSLCLSHLAVTAAGSIVEKISGCMPQVGELSK